MITIVDYQMGNLRSVQKGIEKVGFEARVSSDPNEIATAERLILPGVGGFGEAIDEIRRRDLEQPILDFLQTGRPFLGICLGLQLLFEYGYEGGKFRGLGVLPGDVARFQIDPALKVPHMGWNTVSVPDSFQGGRASCLLDGIETNAHFYFVHSYYVRPEAQEIVALEADYGGPFCAMIEKDNLFATQFHPEKSQRDGLKLLSNFATFETTASTK